MPFPDFEPTMPRLLATVAERHGSRSLLVTAFERLTYHDADARSRAIAAGLLARGVGKGDHVGILMPNSADWVVAFFAVTRVGAVAVPINTFVKPRELVWQLRHADVSQLMCHPHFLANDYLEGLESAIPSLATNSGGEQLRLTAVPLLRHVFVWGPCNRGWAQGGETELAANGRAAGIDEAFVAAVEACVTPADPVVIVYTSGSTGDPKGIVHSHGAVVRHSYNLTFSYVTTGEDVMFTSMPFFWIGGLITGLLAVVHHGATIVTQPAFDAGKALELIERERATIALGWPQQGKSLREHPRHGATDLSSLRRTSMPDFVPLTARPPAISSLSLGMTEACGSHTNFDPYVALDESKRGTFGPSVEGLEHKIIDPHTREPLPAGTEGEICVRGYSMMLGRQKVERQDIFDADGWYHTGDTGYLDAEGWLFFTGRLGDMIKTGGGVNVTPAEVEAALTALPEVLEAYVTGVPDRSGAAGTQVVAAAVVPRTGSEIEPGEVQKRLKDRLSAFKIPKQVWICDKADLPFADSGKIKKTELARLLASRLP
jgi:acyl-CoA synthetase (AMP-forming)/AMP-acid ligase II